MLSTTLLPLLALFEEWQKIVKGDQFCKTLQTTWGLSTSAGRCCHEVFFNIFQSWQTFSVLDYDPMQHVPVYIDLYSKCTSLKIPHLSIKPDTDQTKRPLNEMVFQSCNILWLHAFGQIVMDGNKTTCRQTTHRYGSQKTNSLTKNNSQTNQLIDNSPTWQLTDKPSIVIEKWLYRIP